MSSASRSDVFTPVSSLVNKCSAFIVTVDVFGFISTIPSCVLCRHLRDVGLLFCLLFHYSNKLLYFSIFVCLEIIKFCFLSTLKTFKSEKAMAPHSSTLAWKIPWTEEPGGLQSMGSLRVGHD